MTVLKCLLAQPQEIYICWLGRIRPHLDLEFFIFLHTWVWVDSRVLHPILKNFLYPTWSIRLFFDSQSTQFAQRSQHNSLLWLIDISYWVHLWEGWRNLCVRLHVFVVKEFCQLYRNFFMVQQPILTWEDWMHCSNEAFIYHIEQPPVWFFQEMREVV